MDYKEETYLLDTIDDIKEEVHENNRMLKQIIRVINTYILNHHNENEDDFGRNVLANLISSGIDIKKVFNRRC